MNAIDQIDPNATSITSPRYSVHETVFGRQQSNLNQPALIAGIGAEGRVCLQYPGGFRRWIHLINLGASYRKAGPEDVIPTWPK
ncbi:MAG: hypothetical protein EOO70_06990, partial [Myxococcaceae bacterium]